MEVGSIPEWLAAALTAAALATLGFVGKQILRGDHVIGLAVVHDGGDEAFANRVKSALEIEFPGYEIQRLRPGA